MPSDTFANRLAMMRHELGLTLDEAADRAGLKRATWRTWERGLSKPRDMASVVTQIADAFEYDPMWLMWGGPLGGDDDPDRDPASRKFRSTRGSAVVLAALRNRRRGHRAVALAQARPAGEAAA